MITKIKGIIAEIKEKTIEMTIISGITVEIFVVNPKKFQINLEFEILIFSFFSADKGYVLYGFTSELEKSYFLLLQECHGIGSKIALHILNNLSLGMIYSAILQEKKSVFESITGVGKKKSELIIVELKSKIYKLPVENEVIISSHYSDLEQALEALGFEKRDRAHMIQRVYELPNSNNFSLEVLISKALEKVLF